MRSRLTFTISLIVVAGLVLVSLAFEARRSRTSAPVVAASAAVQDAQLALDPDTLVGWYEGPAQPIFFSHRRHAGVYQIDCLYCHSNTDVSPVAPIPALETCLGCHRVVKATSPEILKLRGYEQRGEPILWERIYKLYDFVQFNHSRHILASVGCEECHGKVEETDVLYQWPPLTMGWCLECHWKPPVPEERAAEMMAEAERISARFSEEGRESRGLYPRKIDSQYGVTNGPIDCVACHY